MTPNPTERATILNAERTPYIRKLYCVYQSQCLKIATKGKWDGMSCEFCDVEQPLTRIEMQADLEAMSRMWSCA